MIHRNCQLLSIKAQPKSLDILLNLSRNTLQVLAVERNSYRQETGGEADFTLREGNTGLVLARLGLKLAQCNIKTVKGLRRTGEDGGAGAVDEGKVDAAVFLEEGVSVFGVFLDFGVTETFEKQMLSFHDIENDKNKGETHQ